MTKVSEFKETALTMVTKRGIISAMELFDALVDLNPNWKGTRQKTFAGNINNTSRHNEKARLGEGAESPYNKMMKTEYKVEGHSDRVAICHIDFDDEINTDAEFRNRTYHFTPKEWDEELRKKNESTDKEDVPDKEDAGGTWVDKSDKEKVRELIETLGIDREKSRQTLGKEE